MKIYSSCHSLTDSVFALITGLVLPAVGDDLLLRPLLQADLGQYRHPVLVCLAQQIVKEDLESV